MRATRVPGLRHAMISRVKEGGGLRLCDLTFSRSGAGELGCCKCLPIVFGRRTVGKQHL